MQPVMGPFYNQCTAQQADATSDRDALQPDVTSDGAAAPQPDAVMGPLLNQRCNPRCNEW